MYQGREEVPFTRVFMTSCQQEPLKYPALWEILYRKQHTPDTYEERHRIQGVVPGGISRLLNCSQTAGKGRVGRLGTSPHPLLSGLEQRSHTGGSQDKCPLRGI